eukprot:CAMPEP_0202452552 /NCGR_PEP_ID=MMETSP1360-20130828/10741_1 /ASSEMBLY_ACC=CAM_ASM_000848 /TAXON_ID=515479 /ORGANISM="Licmophora paradoxa, Strain CCMP2313" /LENGTH=417 /DNA_ID=CAMNT_0049071407 /DNA_START=12 /DNA_END=1265 /DNA_ORIENTATION=+
MDEGLEKYGPLFKNQVYMVALHIYATDSLRGEQAHFGAHFIPFHSALTAMYETTVLAITQHHGLELESTPYWWCFNDTDQSDIIGPEYFGTYPGKGPNYEVIDGRFAFWEIPTYNESYPQYIPYVADPSDCDYTGSEAGFLRESTSCLTSDYMVAFPSSADMNQSAKYEAFPLEPIMGCIACGYDSEDYNIFHFSWCVQEKWHIWIHSDLGGWRYRNDPGGIEYSGDFNGQQGNSNPIFIPFHNTVDMFYTEWLSSNLEWANTSWGYPYENGFNYLTKRTYDGINAWDTINSAFPIRYKDVGWADPSAENANTTVNYLEALCYFVNENADYLYVKFSGAPDTAPGEIVSPRNSTNTTGITTTTVAASEETISVGNSDGLTAAEAFLKAYDANSDNRLEAAEAFLETLTADSSGGRRD